MMLESHRKFLLEQAGTDKITHSGRTLFDHLAGTHALLRCWLADDDVCLAGLFHSIYGTRTFRKRAWPLDDRATIQRLIGPRAEALAHIFGTVDRSHAFFLSPDNMVLRHLREIEAANLIDQGSHGKQLRRIWETPLRMPVRHAIAEHMQEAA